MKKQQKWIIAALLAVILIYSGFRAAKRWLVAPHALDPAPVTTPAHNDLGPGVIETKFIIDTGGDQLSFGRNQVGLGVIVRFPDRDVRQIFASRNDVLSEGVLLPGLALTSATCDKREFYMTTGFGKVNVLENTSVGMVIRASIPLPQGIDHAVLTK